jgi:hypothetical protein
LVSHGFSGGSSADVMSGTMKHIRVASITGLHDFMAVSPVAKMIAGSGRPAAFYISIVRNKQAKCELHAQR